MLSLESGRCIISGLMDIVLKTADSVCPGITIITSIRDCLILIYLLLAGLVVKASDTLPIK